MQFLSTINGLETFEINYGLNRGEVELDRVEIYDMDGEQVMPDEFSETDWETIRELCEADYLEQQIARAAELRWD